MPTLPRNILNCCPDLVTNSIAGHAIFNFFGNFIAICNNVQLRLYKARYSAAVKIWMRKPTAAAGMRLDDNLFPATSPTRHGTILPVIVAERLAEDARRCMRILACSSMGSGATREGAA